MSKQGTIVGTKSLGVRKDMFTKEGLPREVVGTKLTNLDVQKLYKALEAYQETGCEISLFIDTKKTNEGNRQFKTGFYKVQEPYTPADAPEKTTYIAVKDEAIASQAARIQESVNG